MLFKQVQGVSKSTQLEGVFTSNLQQVCGRQEAELAEAVELRKSVTPFSCVGLFFDVFWVFFCCLVFACSGCLVHLDRCVFCFLLDGWLLLSVWFVGCFVLVLVSGCLFVLVLVSGCLLVLE